MPTPRPEPPLSSPAAEFAGWLRAARYGSRADLGRALEACRAYLQLIAESELGATLRAKVGSSDVVQESLLDAHRGFPHFRGTTRDEFLAWVGQILRHNLLDLARRYREADARRVDRERPLDPAAAPVAELEDDGTPPDRRAVRAEDAARLRAALGRLSDDYQQVIQLRHHDRLGWDEIAAMIGRTPEAARKLWFRAVERLRLELALDPG